MVKKIACSIFWPVDLSGSGRWRSLLPAVYPLWYTVFKLVLRTPVNIFAMSMTRHNERKLLACVLY
ncbi:MAG: hypothetical protein GY796_15915 [Chloroflexi bacterium]|nr:hypothetical protein [Chloroflexota bacterium]